MQHICIIVKLITIRIFVIVVKNTMSKVVGINRVNQRGIRYSVQHPQTTLLNQ